MTPPAYDIFKKDASAAMIWVESVEDLESAKMRVRELSRDSNTEYAVSINIQSRSSSRRDANDQTDDSPACSFTTSRGFLPSRNPIYLGMFSAAPRFNYAAQSPFAPAITTAVTQSEMVG
jgi:hypothetical protein